MVEIDEAKAKVFEKFLENHKLSNEKLREREKGKTLLLGRVFRFNRGRRRIITA